MKRSARIRGRVNKYVKSRVEESVKSANNSSDVGVHDPNMKPTSDGGEVSRRMVAPDRSDLHKAAESLLMLYSASKINPAVHDERVVLTSPGKKSRAEDTNCVVISAIEEAHPLSDLSAKPILELTPFVHFSPMPEIVIKEHFVLFLNQLAWKSGFVAKPETCICEVTVDSEAKSACVEFISVRIASQISDMIVTNLTQYENCKILPTQATKPVESKEVAPALEPTAFVEFSSMPDFFIKDHFKLFLNQLGWKSGLTLKPDSCICEMTVNDDAKTARVEFSSVQIASKVCEVITKSLAQYENCAIVAVQITEPKKCKDDPSLELTAFVQFSSMPEFIIKDHFKLYLNQLAWKCGLLEKPQSCICEVTVDSAAESACVEFISVEVASQVCEEISKSLARYENCAIVAVQITEPKKCKDDPSLELTALVEFSSMPEFIIKDHFKLYLNQLAWKCGLLEKPQSCICEVTVDSAAESACVEFISVEVASQVCEEISKSLARYENCAIVAVQITEPKKCKDDPSLELTAFVEFSSMPEFIIKEHFTFYLRQLAWKCGLFQKPDSCVCSVVVNLNANTACVEFTSVQVASLMCNMINKNHLEYENCKIIAIQSRLFVKPVEVEQTLPNFDEPTLDMGPESESTFTSSSFVKISNLSSDFAVINLLQFIYKQLLLYAVVNVGEHAILNYCNESVRSVCIELKSAKTAHQMLQLNGLMNFQGKNLCVNMEPVPSKFICKTVVGFCAQETYEDEGNEPFKKVHRLYNKYFNHPTRNPINIPSTSIEPDDLASGFETSSPIREADRSSSVIMLNDSMLEDSNKSSDCNTSLGAESDEDSVQVRHHAPEKKTSTLDSDSAVSAFLTKCKEFVDKGSFFKPTYSTYSIIISSIDEENGIDVTVPQCRSKWKSLNARYKTEKAKGSASAWVHRFDMAELKGEPNVFGASKTKTSSPMASFESISPEKFYPKSLNNFRKGAVMKESAVLMLIDLRTRLKKQFDSSTHRNSSLWRAISKRMCKLGHYFTPDQCEAKMDRLIRTYKDYVDAGKKTGAGNSGLEFYDELHALLGDNVTVKPLLTMSCGSTSISSVNKKLMKENMGQSRMVGKQRPPAKRLFPSKCVSSSSKS